MYRSTYKYTLLTSFVLVFGVLFSQENKTELHINTGLSFFKNQFFDYKFNKDQPHVSKAGYLAIELQENKHLFKISFSKTYWLMISPANLTQSLSAQASYDNISILKTFKLKNNKLFSVGVGHSFISEQCYLLSPPSHKFKTGIGSKQSMFGGIPLINPYSSRAISFSAQYNLTKHLYIGLFANYNYIRRNNYIQLGLPINNVQFQIFYKFIKAKE